MTEALLPWHAKATERFRRALTGQRMHHAWLIRGAKGIGKAWFAEFAARELLCEQMGVNGRCGQCKSCLLSNAGNHPDYVELVAEEGKTEIGVDRVRSVLEQAALTRRLAPFKPVVVPNADGLGVSGANALLKTLEEPPLGTVFLLCSARSAVLAPTIRSRCQHLDLPMPSREQAVAWLSAQPMSSIEPEFINEILDAADGAPFTALAIANDPEALAFRTSLRQELADLLNGHANPVATAKIWSKAPLDLLLGWMLGLGNSLIRRTLTDETAVGGRNLDVRRLYAILDQITEARRAVTLRANLNTTLLLESLALNWAGGRKSV